MARKRKASEPHPAATSPHHQKNAPSSIPSRPKMKRKIDWATIDEGDGFDGFTVKALAIRLPKAPNKKQKTVPQEPKPNASDKDASMDAELTQKNPFPETDLTEVHCKVEPAAEWESTQRYRKFTINGEEFEVGQVVFVKKTEENHDTPSAIPQWFAKVLEVRAGDASHVYLRVFWAYRPEDLPGGRQPHHGASELIVSNHMDVIEALTVESVANVMYWNDSPEDSEWPPKDHLFWRQSFDINKPKGKHMSKLSTHCIDKKPCNPDEPLVYCSSCKKWLHAHCLEEQAVKQALAEHRISPSSDSTKAKASSKQPAKASIDEALNAPHFTAELNTSDAGKTCLTLTERRTGQTERQWDVDVICLMCNNIIEKAEKAASPDSGLKTPMTDTKEAAGEPNGNATVNATTTTTSPPINTEDKDSVISDDAQASSTLKPEPPTAQYARPVRGRGRPLGSVKKARKRLVANTITTSILVATPAPASTPPPPPVPIPLPVLTPTPASSTTESVFQSGFKSIKNLFWGAT